MKRNLEICRHCNQFLQSKDGKKFACFSPVYTDFRCFFYTQEEFESIDIEDDCVLYPEHCMKEWNKKGEKHEQKA